MRVPQMRVPQIDLSGSRPDPGENEATRCEHLYSADEQTTMISRCLRLLTICWILSTGQLAECKAADAVFSGWTRGDRPISGRLVGNTPQELQVVSADGTTLSLNRIQRLDLPVKPRRLPNWGWKRARLINGDILHIGFDSSQPSTFKMPFALPGELKRSAVSSLSQLAGLQCLLFEDFSKTGREFDQARSGQRAGPIGPASQGLMYKAPQPLPAGRLQFSFYIDPELQPDGTVSCRLQFGGMKPFEVALDIVDAATTYRTHFPAGFAVDHQLVRRSSGWHVAQFHWEASKIAVTVDDFLVASAGLNRDQAGSFSSIEFKSTLQSSRVWLDDLALCGPRSDSTSPVLERDIDQIDLANGDQVFGQIQRLNSHELEFGVNSESTAVDWSSIVRVHFAKRRAPVTPVAGWITAIEFQPWSVAPNLDDCDALRGAIQSISEGGCVVEHPLCGRLMINWTEIRQIQPDYWGQEWVLEGGPRHLGDEIKSALMVPTNEGTRLQWSFNLAAESSGVASVTFDAADLEPCGKGTRPHKWLDELRRGRLISELWINEKRIAILNQYITGRASVDQPHRLRIPLPDKCVKKGQNNISIRLVAGGPNLAEYDDWELRNMRLEIHSK